MPPQKTNLTADPALLNLWLGDNYIPGLPHYLHYTAYHTAISAWGMQQVISSTEALALLQNKALQADIDATSMRALLDGEMVLVMTEVAGKLTFDTLPLSELQTALMQSYREKTITTARQARAAARKAGITAAITSLKKEK